MSPTVRRSTRKINKRFRNNPAFASNFFFNPFSSTQPNSQETPPLLKSQQQQQTECASFSVRVGPSRDTNHQELSSCLNSSKINLNTCATPDSNFGSSPFGNIRQRESTKSGADVNGVIERRGRRNSIASIGSRSSSSIGSPRSSNSSHQKHQQRYSLPQDQKKCTGKHERTCQEMVVINQGEQEQQGVDAFGFSQSFFFGSHQHRMNRVKKLFPINRIQAHRTFSINWKTTL